MESRRTDGRRSLIGDEAARLAARGEAPSRRSMIGTAAVVRERSGVWEVRDGGVFVGDYVKREHAEAAAAERSGPTFRKDPP